MTAAAAFDNVVKTYPVGLFGLGKQPAVRGVTLEIPAGQPFALLGPNRAGKTTLVKLLLNLARPSRGSVTRLGLPVRNRQTLARVGYMHENHAFPRYLSATEVLHFYGGLGGVDGERLGGKVEQMLERVGLADRRRDPISRYSKGMVQRLGLAQALMNDPDLLVLDEPTEGLDLFGRQLLRAIVRERTASGKTVLLVSHVLPEIEELCERGAVLVDGRLAWVGELKTLKSDGRGDLEAGLQGVYDRGAAA